MRFAAATAAILATAVSAAPAPAAGEYKWEVTKWVAGCTGDSCPYSFDISGPASSEYPAKPAFKAHCEGLSTDGKIATEFADCKTLEGDFNGRVVSRMNTPPELLGSRTVAPIEVALLFSAPEDANTNFNVTGYANTSFNRGSGTDFLSFTITPNVTVGVA